MSNNATCAARVWAVLREGSAMGQGREPGGVCAECGRRRRKLRRGVCDTCGTRVPDLPETGWRVADVAVALGVSNRMVRHWIAGGWLRPLPGRTPVVVSDGALHAFLWTYPRAWSWAAVDPDHRAWVHSLLHDNDLVVAASKAVRAARKAALAAAEAEAAA